MSLGSSCAAKREVYRVNGPRLPPCTHRGPGLFCPFCNQVTDARFVTFAVASPAKSEPAETPLDETQLEAIDARARADRVGTISVASAISTIVSEDLRSLVAEARASRSRLADLEQARIGAEARIADVEERARRLRRLDHQQADRGRLDHGAERTLRHVQPGRRLSVSAPWIRVRAAPGQGLGRGAAKGRGSDVKKLACGHDWNERDGDGGCNICSGDAKAATLGSAFIEAHRSELAQAVLTYADKDGEEILERLRERFWGGGPEDWTKEERGE